MSWQTVVLLIAGGLIFLITVAILTWAYVISKIMKDS